MSDLTPKRIVEELDRYIIGQSEAKKAVAVALRNRWRRRQLDGPLQEEVTPKNILMIGPTGVGKTEISRRLAKLADAPFLKVEATKFTEVGYVGRDVDSIVRDLTEVAINLVRERRREAVKDRAKRAAEDRVIDALVGDTATEATRESCSRTAPCRASSTSTSPARTRSPTTSPWRWRPGRRRGEACRTRRTRAPSSAATSACGPSNGRRPPPCPASSRARPGASS